MTLNKPEKHIYIKNVFIPLALITIGVLVVFVLYKISYQKTNLVPALKPQAKLSLNAKANFFVNSTVKILSSKKNQNIASFTGECLTNIDLSSGEITLKSLRLKSDEPILLENDINISHISIDLDPSYNSTGKIDISKGCIYVGLNSIIKLSVNNQKNTFKSIDIAIPLNGYIDKNSGTIKLFGEATIPPKEINMPLPIKVTTILTTEQNYDTEPTHTKED